MDQETLKRGTVRVPSAPQPPRRDAIPVRQIVGGALALIIAMSLIGVFARVVHLGGQAAATTTAQAQMTAQSPTATPAPQTAAEAWGAALTRHSLRLADGTTFIPTDAAPDGSFLVGYVAGGSGTSYYVASVALPSFTPQRLFTLPSDAAVPIVKTDGNFVAWIGSDTPGTNEAVHQTIGYYNLATSSYNELYDAFTLEYNPAVFAVANGTFYWSPVKSPDQLSATTMANGNTAPVPLGAGAALTGLEATDTYLVYTLADGSIHTFAIAAGHDSPIPGATLTGASDRLALAETTLYWAHAGTTPGTTLVESFSPLPGPSMVRQTVLTIGAAHLATLSAGTRLLAWDDGQTRVAFDLTTRRRVTLGAAVAGHTPLMGQHGVLLWSCTADAQVVLVRLDRLPAA